MSPAMPSTTRLELEPDRPYDAWSSIRCLGNISSKIMVEVPGRRRSPVALEGLLAVVKLTVPHFRFGVERRRLSRRAVEAI